MISMVDFASTFNASEGQVLIADHETLSITVDSDTCGSGENEWGERLRVSRNERSSVPLLSGRGKSFVQRLDLATRQHADNIICMHFEMRESHFRQKKHDLLLGHRLQSVCILRTQAPRL